MVRIRGYCCENILKCKALLLASCLAVGNVATAPAHCPPQGEIHHYREVCGETVREVEWCLQQKDGYTLTYTSPDETSVTVTDPAYNTRRWHMITKDGQTDVMAERDGDVIVLSGRFGNTPVNKRLEIDGCPWYQATSLSLRGLTASNAAERLFWTIRLKTLTVHKIKAIKKGVERLEVNHDFLHIRLTLPGWLAPFWKSDYWFALPGGVFFRFQGPSGPPGSPMVTITRTAG